VISKIQIIPVTEVWGFLWNVRPPSYPQYCQFVSRLCVTVTENCVENFSVR